MTASELISLLEDLDPDTEVRLAMQPSWPFEYSIERGVLVDAAMPAEDDDLLWTDGEGFQYRAHVLETYTDGRIKLCYPSLLGTPIYETVSFADFCRNTGRESEPVFFLAEGSQLGYLGGAAKGELGWGR